MCMLLVWNQVEYASLKRQSQCCGGKITFCNVEIISENFINLDTLPLLQQGAAHDHIHDNLYDLFRALIVF